MTKRSKRRNRPTKSDANNLKTTAAKLEQAIQSEQSQCLNPTDRTPWEVSMEARDGAIHVLRFLKVWFDVPETVFFSAASYLDQLLVRMKVNAKFLSCLSISCFNIAAKKHGVNLNASQLVNISQSKCSLKDMDRMSGIIIDKINNKNTALELLEIYLEIFRTIAVQFNTEILLDRMLPFGNLVNRLEILISDYSCAQFQPSILTLAFIQCEMERFLGNEIPAKSSYYTTEMFYLLAIMIELQCLCKMNTSDYAVCLENIKNSLTEYDKQYKSKHHQKLSWYFSTSTIAIVGNNRNFQTSLITLNEE